MSKAILTQEQRAQVLQVKKEIRGIIKEECKKNENAYDAFRKMSIALDSFNGCTIYGGKYKGWIVFEFHYKMVTTGILFNHLTNQITIMPTCDVQMNYFTQGSKEIKTYYKW